jgi:hypothetical protein
VSTIIVPESMYFGAPTSLKVGGVEVGGTLDAPKVAFDIEKVTPDFKNAKGPVKGTVIVRKVVPRLEFMVNELTAAKIAWAMPGVTSTVGTGATTADGHDEALAADSAVGATVIKFPATDLATSAAADDIIDTATPHGFVAGQRVRFESLTGGTGLVVGTDYFVIAASLGATTLKVSLTAGGGAVDFSTDVTAGVIMPAYTVGEFLKIGDAGETEIREISAVGTSGAGGTGLTLGVALNMAHDAGDAILQVDDAGTTLLTWTPGRVPSASYRDVEAIGPGLDGRTMRVLVKNALSADNLEIPLDDENMAGLSMSMIGHYVYDGTADSGKVPFEIELF